MNSRKRTEAQRGGAKPVTGKDGMKGKKLIKFRGANDG
jgi:hypothetical protein